MDPVKSAELSAVVGEGSVDIISRTSVAAVVETIVGSSAVAEAVRPSVIELARVSRYLPTLL